MSMQVWLAFSVACELACQSANQARPSERLGRLIASQFASVHHNYDQNGEWWALLLGNMVRIQCHCCRCYCCCCCCCRCFWWITESDQIRLAAIEMAILDSMNCNRDCHRDLRDFRFLISDPRSETSKARAGIALSMFIRHKTIDSCCSKHNNCILWNKPSEGYNNWYIYISYFLLIFIIIAKQMSIF